MEEGSNSCSGHLTPASVGQETEWAPGLIWMVAIRKFPASARNETPTVQPVASSLYSLSYPSYAL